MSKYYLTGPMSGIPQFNFPAFHAAAAVLRAVGWDIVSPAEEDTDAVKKEAIVSPDGAMGEDGKIGGETWGDMLARDVKLVADGVAGLILLPGWENSRGAKLECYTGVLCKKEFWLYWDTACEKVDAHYIMDGIFAYTDRK